MPSPDAVHAAWEAGCAELGLAVPLPDVERWVAARDDVDLARPPDLVLAAGCAAGRVEAIAAFDRVHLAEARRAVRKLGLDEAAADELIQELRCKLFVDGEIAGFAGRGALAGWMRSVAVRAGLKALRRARRDLPFDDGALDAIPAADDHALAQLKATYGPVMREALREAFEALAPRQRNLLRQHVLDGLSIDRLATLYRVHRATAARWLVDARAELLETTQGLVLARLGLGSTELASVLRLVRSELDITLASVA